MLMTETPMSVTRAAVKAKGVVAKVQWTANPLASTSEGGEVRLVANRENTPASSKVHLLRVKCRKLLEDSVPSEFKEAQGKPIGEGLQRFVQVAILVNSSFEGPL